MTLAERDVCRVAMRDNLALDNFVSERLSLLLAPMDLNNLEFDLEADALRFDLCKQAYVQGLKDGYQATQGKCEKQLARDREDRVLVNLFARFKREANLDYVNAEGLCRTEEDIAMSYKQGLKEGQLPLGALAV